MNKKRIILILIAAFMTAFYFGLSPLTKLIIESKSVSLIGREIKVDNLKLNILLGKFEAENFTLYEKENQNSFVSFQELKFDINLRKLFSKELAFDYISLSQASVNVIKDNETFNFSDMLSLSDKSKDSKEKKATEKKKDSGLALSIKEFSIDSFTFNYEDVNSQMKINEKIDTISYSNIYVSNTFSLDMKIDIKNKFNVSFDVENKTDELKIDINLMKLDVSFFDNYLSEFVNLSSINGDFKGVYTINIIKDSITLSGNLSGDNIAISDLDKRELVKLESLNVDIEDIDIKNKKATVSSIGLNNPYVYVELDNGKVNFQDIVKIKESNTPQTEKKKTETKEKEEKFDFEIKQINLANGNIAFRDISSEEAFEYELRNLNINIKNINSNLSDIALKLSTNLNNDQAKLNLNADIRSSKNIDGTLKVDKFNLGDFNKYFSEFININELNGNYSGKINYSVNLESGTDIKLSTQSSIDNFSLIASDFREIISFGNFKINLQNFDLKDKTANISLIHLSDPYLLTELDNGSLNLGNLIKVSETDKNSEVKVAQEKPEKEVKTDNKVEMKKDVFKFEIAKLYLTKGNIKFSDISSEKHFNYELNDLNIKMENINSNLENMKLELSSKINQSDSLITMESDIESSKIVSGILKVDNFKLGDFNKYAKEFVNINSLSGSYSGDLKFSANLENETDIIISGENTLKNFSLVDTRSIKIAEFKEFQLNIDKFDLKNMSLDISTVYLDSINTHLYYLENGNFLDILPKKDNKNEKPEEETQQKTEIKTKSKEFKYTVENLNIENSSVVYSDENYNTAFEYELLKINLSMKNITNKEKQVTTYKNSIDLNRKGSFISEGEFSLSNKTDFFGVSKIKNLYINDFDPVLEKYSPVIFSNGIIHFDGKSEIKNEKLNLKNSIVLENLEVLKEKKKILDIKVPLNLAIKLLEDEKRQIFLNLPIKGDLSNPELNIKKLIVSTLKETIVHTIKSPLKLLKVLPQQDGSDKQRVKFGYGLKWVTKEFDEHTNNLKKLLEKKKKIKVELLFYNNHLKNNEKLAIDELLIEYKEVNQLTDSSINEKSELFLQYIDSLIEEKDHSLHLGEKCKKILGEEELAKLIEQDRERKINYLKQRFNNNANLEVKFIDDKDTLENEKFPHVKTKLFLD